MTFALNFNLEFTISGNGGERRLEESMAKSAIWVEEKKHEQE